MIDLLVVLNLISGLGAVSCGFLSARVADRTLLTFESRSFLYVGAGLYCGVFRRRDGIYSVDTSSNTFSSCDNCVQKLTDVPRMAKLH